MDDDEAADCAGPRGSPELFGNWREGTVEVYDLLMIEG
jgi:hypothetical protein